ncbi:hypothetical protein CH373_13310 [Leptospira perolatii]|uniref:Fatty acid hydroxylase domain-containing protein n=1 Tax=Leptospira perolatii TaxID=2023191 RepID=A0A2M9ZKW4_9LEPT|nr:sterol desaturase family protein [Leptospira perolatii]PJZ69913.1 hypothetical protein CH360_08375 [Leptospira perolatii]PJZ72679.1 hypothetical protein CH373_13310 [Leptospira perolatii]
MEPISYVAIALGFNFLVLTEAFVSRWKKSDLYSARDAWANIAMYWGNVLTHIPYFALSYPLYSFLSSLSPIHIGTSWEYWLVLFFLDDLCFYWYHRFSHEVHFFWASHINHHSSEYYNLSTALRQTWTPFPAILFWIPVAAIGYPAEMIFAMQAMSLLYQSVLHTQLIPRLPFIDLFLNTPSNHRVHHGSNLEYLDKNYGGVLIIWDRLFGSYEPEKEKVIYGVTKRLTSQDPFVIAFHEYANIVKKSFLIKNFSDLWNLLTKPPAWSEKLGGYESKSEAKVPASQNSVLFSMFLSLYLFILVILHYYLPEKEFNLWMLWNSLVLIQILTAWATKESLRKSRAYGLSWFVGAIEILLLLGFPLYLEINHKQMQILKIVSSVFGIFSALKIYSYFSLRERRLSISDTLFYFLCYPEFASQRLFRKSSESTLSIYKVASKRLILGFVSLGFGFFVTGALLLLPLSWYSTNHSDFKYWILLISKAFSLYLIFRGLLFLILGYFSFEGYSFRKKFPSPLFAESISDFWTKFYPQWNLLLRSVSRWKTVQILVGFGTISLFLEYVLYLFGIRKMGYVSLFFACQSAGCLLEASIANFVSTRARRSKFYKFFSRLILFGVLLISLPLFFIEWDQLFIKVQ